MSFEPESLAHDQLANVQAAVSMEPELESSSISVSMVGRSVLLEGNVADYGDREKATAIAALIAGPENVSDRMRDRDEMASTSPTQE
ncbi:MULTISPECIES: BON domain-containing protein [unclassified Rhizobium]|uniref:BON domain-containing protein n=1 Tax=unclassified Rhizobium TaxID=2613769 RepID=UPI0007EA2DF2|nr:MULTISPECIES: BON domain-containing protein [unclassified Rhizobium]ANM11336.1 BON domain-containing protein [Rhizobium sp. N324]OYD04938.1 BON domain-containing protein [Rhizobium sp. N4311]